MPHHPSSTYLSSKAFGRRWELFRTAQLNGAGWAAVAVVCALGAATGLATARFTGAATGMTMPAGGAAAFAAVIAADRRRWARMTVHHAWTDDLGEVRRVADLLTNAGVAVSVEIDEFDQPSLQYVNRDHRRVARAFRKRRPATSAEELTHRSLRPRTSG